MDGGREHSSLASHRNLPTILTSPCTYSCSSSPMKTGIFLSISFHSYKHTSAIARYGKFMVWCMYDLISAAASSQAERQWAAPKHGRPLPV